MQDVTAWAAQRPDALAIITTTGTRTFAELDANANRLARALRARGLVAGDAVALLAPNQPVFVETVQACLRAGFRLTPVNWHLTGDEASYIVDDCEAKALVTSAELAGVAAPAFAQSPRCTVGLVADGELDGFESYEAALAAESADPLDDATPGSTMLYTSGTTGRPKGVYRPPARVAAVNLGGYHDDVGGDVHLCTGPLYHAAPLAFSLSIPIAAGATVIVMERWDAAHALELIDTHGVTHTHMVPTMFHRLLALPDDVKASADVSSVRHIIHGAAPCPVPVKRGIIEWFGPVVIEYYAATEGSGSYVDSATWLAHPGTVGKPMPEGQVIVGDEEGNPLPTGEVGMLYLRAPEVGRFEYFKAPDKTDSTYRGDYFTLGDVGYLDDEGYLYLTDRTANLIISGGVNVYPAEVDAVLLEHRAVGDVAVIGAPDAEWGERVVAVVELRDGSVPSGDECEALRAELDRHCRDRLAGFKCPRQFDFVTELPRADNGKIYKHRLRAQYREQAAAGA